MNLSGESVYKIMNYYHIGTNDLLIISDDMDLNVGCFKLKANGSSGGHNGLKSIESSLGTNNYKRLKIGISNDKEKDTKDYVLGNFSKEERDTLKELFNNLVEVVDDYFKLPFGDLMSKHNRKNR
jgi:PTH1 family peptidyl-tRNA hydrolase